MVRRILLLPFYGSGTETFTVTECVYSILTNMEKAFCLGILSERRQYMNQVFSNKKKQSIQECFMPAKKFSAQFCSSTEKSHAG